MKKLLVISILVLVVGCSSTSTKTKSNCYDPHPRCEGCSSYGIPQVWSC